MAFKTSSFDGDVHGHCITTTRFCGCWAIALDQTSPFSLLMGVLLGALLITGNPFSAILCRRPLFIDSVADRDGMKVIVFSLFIAGTVEIMRVGQRYPSTGRLGGSVCHHTS